MEFCERWRGWIRPLLVSVYFILFIIALPLCVMELYSVDAPPYVLSWFIGGIFVLMGLPISLWGILQHLIHYTKPDLQRPLIRILWMVPIYSLNAWFALMFPVAAIYLDTLRECYEAYAVYNFMAFLMNYLLSEFPNFEEIVANKPQVKHKFPFCMLPPWSMGRSFISQCKHGVLQYTVLRPVSTLIALFCEWGHVYNEGTFDFRTAWSYLVVLNNISQIWAMYCLFLFYFATKEELKPLKPVSKFLCVKSVVFATFWQSILIAILANTGAIQTIDALKFYDVKQISTGLQDLLICIEMFIAAVAHYYSFSYEPYIDPNVGSVSCYESFVSMWDISDVRRDVVEHVRVVGKGVTKHVPGRARHSEGIEEPVLSSERTPLLNSIGASGEYTQADIYRTNFFGESTDSLNTSPELLSSTSAIHHQRPASITGSMSNFLRLGSSYESGSDNNSLHKFSNASENQIDQNNSDVHVGLLIDIPETVVTDTNLSQDNSDVNTPIDHKVQNVDSH